jgi:hypothetical protein
MNIPIIYNDMSSNMNTAIANFNSIPHQILRYKQVIRMNNPYLDSVYSNHINIKGGYVEITFPTYCDIIMNIQNNKDIKMYIDRYEVTKRTQLNLIKMKENMPKLTIPFVSDLIVTFDVYLIKNKIKSQL